MAHLGVGSRIPDLELGFLDSNGVVQTVSSNKLVARCNAVIIGVPGAFTPVCTQKHIPDFIRNVPKLRAAGYQKLVCIVPNDPFVIAEWARMVDPEGKLLFLSDGNLDFTRAVGVQRNHRTLFLGYRSERYLLVLADCVIQRIRIEPNILSFSCTGAANVLEPTVSESALQAI